MLLLGALLAAATACQESAAVPPGPTSAAVELAAAPTVSPEPPLMAVATPTLLAYPGVTAELPTAPLPYPGATSTPTATAMPAYPGGTAVPPTPTLSAGTTNGAGSIFLPMVAGMRLTPPPAPTDAPPPRPTLTPTPIPTIDFAAVRAQLQASGQELAHVKIGFHVGIGGNSAGLDEWMRQLDAAGVPFFLKSVDNAQPLYFAQQLRQASGVPHVLVYRKASGGDHYNVPDYNLPPEQAALEHWQRHIEAFPPELDPNIVWLETVNEVDRTRSEWLAQFSLATAQLSLAQGYRWAAFGWSSGEPEPEHWQSPAMLEFLRLVGANPDRLAIAIHEYSYTEENIWDAYPYKVGRFLELFRICDQYGIPRPTVLITEWGWTYERVPSPEQAMRDIAWAARLYAPYPQVKGAAIWFLGSGYSQIANEAQRLIQPLLVYTLTNYFVAPPGPILAPPNPELYRP